MANNPYQEKTDYPRIKKHYCPKCNGELTAVTVGNVINTNQKEKNIGSSIAGSNTFGTIKSYSTGFQCIKCRLHFSANDLRKIEYNKKIN